MGLPAFQFELTMVPNMYCRMVCGFTSASQTFATGAAMVTEACAIRFLGMGTPSAPSISTSSFAGRTREADNRKMFAGHVGAALALHPLDRRLPPAALIGAALLLDLVLWVLVLAGKERILVPDDYARHHYLMFDFPWSHGLLAAALWAAAAGVTAAALLASRRAGAVIAAAVLSHWVLDAL